MSDYLTILIVIIIIVALALLISYFNNYSTISDKTKADVAKQLKELQIKANSTDQSHLRDSILSLDSLLAKVFKVYYKNNDNFAENLKKSKHKFDKTLYNEIWKYHKIRNEVVHEGRNVEQGEAKLAYKTYKKAIYKII